MNQSSESPVPKKVTSAVPALLLKVLIVSVFCIAIATALVLHAGTPPQQRNSSGLLQIERGMSVQQITAEAKKSGIVRSSFYLYVLLTYLYDPTTIYAGTYRFEKPYSVFEVAKKLASNDVDAELLTVTIPEGVTRKEIARIAENAITNFDTERFLELTKNNEGYLFPDTYHISPDFTAEEFVSLLTETFGIKIGSLTAKIAESEFTEYEVLIFASILEREANNEESMRMVSGILQNRMDIGMALQTDASIEYVLDKPLSELVPEDLKIDSPYNTYLYRGLPPTPIGNAGLQAIQAVLKPIPSEYFYYITDEDGVFHYAETFDEHKRNIARYLR